MKKKIVTLLIVAMVASLTACGQKGNEDGSSVSGSETQQESVQESTQESEQDPAQETSGEETTEVENTGSQETGETGESQQGTAEETMGQVLLQDFLTRVEAGEAQDIQKLAENLLANPVIQFVGAPMEMEEGYLAGFTEEIHGFKECATFAPMIGTIPFVGYIFTLEEGSDVDAFVQKLKDQADPRWNICTTADETVVEAVGNTVFFVMCPYGID